MSKKEAKHETVEEYNARIAKRIDVLKDVHEEKEREELIKTLNVRDRLMRRTYKKAVEIKLTDDLGEFVIRCRQFTWNEQRTIGGLQKELANFRGDIESEGYKDAELKFFKFVAYPDGICLDPELDMEFWTSGKFGIDVATEIFRQLTFAAQEEAKIAHSFR